MKLRFLYSRLIIFQYIMNVYSCSLGKKIMVRIMDGFVVWNIFNSTVVQIFRMNLKIIEQIWLINQKWSKQVRVPKSFIFSTIYIMSYGTVFLLSRSGWVKENRVYVFLKNFHLSELHVWRSQFTFHNIYK